MSAPRPSGPPADPPAGGLVVAAGQYSDRGRKDINQDFHGLGLPGGALRASKGVAAALADGVSSSSVGHLASQAAVRSFLADYYCTPEAWSVKTSAQRVLAAANSWLHAQTRRSRHRYDRDRGYVCTLSALVIKAATAHVFHVGDSRIHRLRGGRLEQLTDDHRVAAGDRSYLGRALGIDTHVEIDYRAEPVEEGDVFVLTTDGVHEHVAPAFMAAAIRQSPGDLDGAARRIAGEAHARGSTDNLTVLIVAVAALPEAGRPAPELPPPPLPGPRMRLDGYRLLRELHGSSRSHIYLAEDEATGELAALKLPSLDRRDDPAYLERFMLEEWIARRLDSAHVLKPCRPGRQRSCLYVATEYVDGQTLAQWMIDHPAPALETVRGIVEQIARGLRAFHRLEMLHQDLRPDNVMIDASGTVKIIDFGAVRVAGLAEAERADTQPPILGTVQYTAPEYFLGEAGSPGSDLYSLGVIAYQMLSGRLPYGAEGARARTRAAQGRLRYRSVLDESREIPAWVDGALARAVHPDPAKRYGELSEFIHDLRHPSPAWPGQGPPPLAERHPLAFWQGLSFLLALALLVLLGVDTLGR